MRCALPTCIEPSAKVTTVEAARERFGALVQVKVSPKLIGAGTDCAEFIRHMAI